MSWQGIKDALVWAERVFRTEPFLVPLMVLSSVDATFHLSAGDWMRALSAATVSMTAFIGWTHAAESRLNRLRADLYKEHSEQLTASVVDLLDLFDRIGFRKK